MPYKDIEKRREAARRGSKRWAEKHPEKLKAVRIAFYERNKAKQCKSARDWYHANKERTKARLRKWRLITLYGLTEAQFDALGDRCAICGATEDTRISATTKKKFRLAVDHCHDTNKVRGLLCGNCNSGIGLFQHDVARLESAIAYLKRSM